MTIEDLALLFTRGIGSRGAAQLIDYFGSAERLFAASRSELIDGAGLRLELAERILAREGMTQALREVEYCRRHRIIALAATDDEYPELLRDASDRPHVIFVQGNIAALAQNTISIVGTRAISPTGQHCTTTLIGELADKVDNLVIVSGLAYGVDAAAHRAALANDTPTVAVVATTLPEVSPAAHRSLADDILHHGGALVSELHSASHQNGNHFLARNRIIAALSRGTLVVESPVSGGALATAKIADSYHRAVMALPGRITDATSFGTNNLIRSGKARLVLTADDIIEDMCWEARPHKEQGTPSTAIELSDAERLVYDLIAAAVAMDVDALIAASRMTMGELSMVLMDLEMHGIIRCVGGRNYEKI